MIKSFQTLSFIRTVEKLNSNYAFFFSAEPQQIVEVPVISDITDNNVTISWTEAAGEVSSYLVQYTWIVENSTVIFNVTISNAITSFTLTGLEQETDYSLVILTVNSRGISRSSPAASFTTLGESMKSVRRRVAGKAKELNREKESGCLGEN